MRNHILENTHLIIMKILAIADRMITEKLPEIIEQNGISLVILLGDLKYIDICDLQDINIPIIGIYGNHCKSEYLDFLGATNLHNKKINLLGYSFSGLEGCPIYKGGDHQLSEQEAKEALIPADIIISHSPPMGVNSTKESQHQGFQSLTDLLDEYSPRFLFHGHSYPDVKISKYKDTVVFYVSGLSIIDLDVNYDNIPVAKPY